MISIPHFYMKELKKRYRYFTCKGKVYRYPVSKTEEGHPVTEERPGRANRPAPGLPVRATGTERSGVSRDEP